MFSEPLKSSFAAAVAAAVCVLIASSFALSVVFWALALQGKTAAMSAARITRHVLLIGLLPELFARSYTDGLKREISHKNLLKRTILLKFRTVSAITLAMSLSIQSRIVGADVVVLDVSGKFVAHEDSLKASVNALLADGRRRFLLNLAGVPYVGSWGITQIISAYGSIRKNGGTMDLVSPGKVVRDVFAVTSLDRVFTIYNDEAEALRASGR